MRNSWIRFILFAKKKKKKFLFLSLSLHLFRIKLDLHSYQMKIVSPSFFTFHLKHKNLWFVSKFVQNYIVSHCFSLLFFCDYPITVIFFHFKTYIHLFSFVVATFYFICSVISYFFIFSFSLVSFSFNLIVFCNQIEFSSDKWKAPNRSEMCDVQKQQTGGDKMSESLRIFLDINFKLRLLFSYSWGQNVTKSIWESFFFSTYFIFIFNNVIHLHALRSYTNLIWYVLVWW